MAQHTVPEYPCSGDVIQLNKFSTERLHVALCAHGAALSFQFVPDSDWVKAILQAEPLHSRFLPNGLSPLILKTRFQLIPSP